MSSVSSVSSVSLLATLNTIIKNHPQILYKGIPLLIICYYFYPVGIFFIYWSPWLYTGYSLWERIPDFVKKSTYETVVGFFTRKKSWTEKYYNFELRGMYDYFMGAISIKKYFGS